MAYGQKSDEASPSSLPAHPNCTNNFQKGQLDIWLLLDERRLVWYHGSVMSFLAGSSIE
jgi:hypothetical protein